MKHGFNHLFNLLASEGRRSIESYDLLGKVLIHTDL
jgi:hypothetical protein